MIVSDNGFLPLDGQSPRRLHAANDGCLDFADPLIVIVTWTIDRDSEILENLSRTARQDQYPVRQIDGFGLNGSQKPPWR